MLYDGRVGIAERCPGQKVGWVRRMQRRDRIVDQLRSRIAVQPVPDDEQIMAAIAQHSPAALVRTKRAIWDSLERGLTAALEHAWSHIEAHKDHPDMREGARAFAEKRPPRWAPPDENP